MADEEFLARKIEALLASRPIPPIWLTHGPPFGVCDEARASSQASHCGSQALKEAILAYQPKLVICGHIHEGAARGRLGTTEIRNVSILNDDYEWYREAILIDIPG